MHQPQQRKKTTTSNRIEREMCHNFRKNYLFTRRDDINLRSEKIPCERNNGAHDVLLYGRWCHYEWTSILAARYLTSASCCCCFQLLLIEYNLDGNALKTAAHSFSMNCMRTACPVRGSPSLYLSTCAQLTPDWNVFICTFILNNFKSNGNMQKLKSNKIVLNHNE